MHIYIKKLFKGSMLEILYNEILRKILYYREISFYRNFRKFLIAISYNYFVRRPLQF